MVAGVRPLLSRPDAGAVAACAAIAALSLLLPSSPTYDPWAWLIWGREVAQLDLVTTEGPSWKPLPVAFTTLFSLLGDDAAPDLWLATARTGALLALVLAYRLGARLAGRAAGAAAALALLLSVGYVRNLWLGNSEGLLVALVFWGVERHLDGRRGQALALGAGAALLRPETWPLLGLYGLWLWMREPRMRRALVITALALAALWFLPELWGSGDPLRASERANEPRPDSPAFADRPALALLERAAELPPPPAVVAFAAGLLLACAALWRRRTGAAPKQAAAVTLALGFAALGVLALVALMTEAGYSGNYRYLVLPGALASVVAGVGFAGLARLAPARFFLAAATLLAAASLPWVVERVEGLDRERVRLTYESRLFDDLGLAVERAGGRGRLLTCGDPYTGALQVPSVAWHLGVHIERVHLEPVPPAVIFRARPTAPERPAPGPGAAGDEARPVARAGGWIVLEACRDGSTLR